MVRNKFACPGSISSKLEENCDISRNNNVWTRFYDLFVGHFEFCRIIFIMTD